MKLTDTEKSYLEGFVDALNRICILCGSRDGYGKSYDPMTIDDEYMHSYVFNMNDGGRHHPLSDYDSIGEIKDVLLKEAEDEINENMDSFLDDAE